MKHLLVILAVLLSSLFLGCGVEPDMTSSRLSLPFDERAFLDGSISYYDNGVISNGTLKSDTDISRITYRNRTSLCFYNSGQVKRGILNSNQIIGDFGYGGEVFFYKDGRVKQGTLIGVQTNTNSGIIYGRGSIYFYPSGMVSNGILSGIQEIDGVSYLGGVPTPIFFYENGQVKQGGLSRDLRVDNVVYRGGSIISFHYPFPWPNINVEQGTLKHRTRLEQQKHIPYGAGTVISFYQNKRVRQGMIDNSFGIDIIIEERHYSNDSIVSFYENGRLKQGRLGRDAAIGGTTYRKGNWLRFSESGDVVGSSASRDSSF